jgi:hypothetical protein
MTRQINLILNGKSGVGKNLCDYPECRQSDPIALFDLSMARIHLENDLGAVEIQLAKLRCGWSKASMR